MHRYRILEAIAPEENNGLDDDDYGDSSEPASIIISGPERPSSSLAGSQPNYEYYRHRLAPLMDLEQRLITVLSDPEDNAEQEATHLPASPSFPEAPRNLHHAHSTTSFHAARPAPRITIPPPPPLSTSPSTSSSSYGYSSFSSSSHSHPLSSQLSPTSPTASFMSSSTNELAVRTGSSWRRHFTNLGKVQSQKTPLSGEVEGWWEDPNDPVHTLNRSAETMKELWRDPRVRRRLEEKQIRLEESSGL